MGLLGFSLMLLSMLQIVASQQVTDPNEVEALNKIISHWNLGTKLNFSGVDPCTQNATWAPDSANPQIACHCAGTTCHVTRLKIYALDISGEIPNELFMLKELQNLNLAQNVLSGPISPEIGQLTNMQYLTVGINNLSGPVPPELGNLTKLLSLGISSNNFQGPLPAELGNLTSLQQLYIDSSGVSGPIPQQLSSLKSLQKLWASDNLFTGKIPEFLGTFTDLIDLRLEGTMLEGPIPTSLGALTKLDDLRIGDLSMEDSSLDFVENMTSLSILSLRNCRVAGLIPEKLSTFSNLKILDLSFNKLTGQIPISFQNFISLNYLYLGSNNLSGELPPNIISQNLLALDVSFNSLSGNLPLNSAKVGLSMNVVGTSVNANSLLYGKASGMLQCLVGGTKCSNKVPATSFSIKCGGTEQTSASGIKFDDDAETLGAASMYSSSDHQWAVSNTGSYISNPNGPQYTTQTDSQIMETLESELYKSARISPSSLRYYGLGLMNGKYNVELHFAEIQMDDNSSHSWKGLGRRFFDVYIQGERVLQDFNIKNEAGGSKRALARTFEANVTNTVMDIHFFWAGRGTCCIPYQSTYGPLVSAIHVSQASNSISSSKRDKKRVGRIVGVAVGCAAGLVIISSVFYLWWTKEKPTHMRVHTDAPRKV
ncbi:putative LRR receptor-like serine/threonine-protein kinase [Camellia lanceoleosa]|uniref:LRR receptor-like serine/threonine-protein kinase n=1 Tax=Camellia lanceoleosa TaxID=1840588 RepID=A0ACC0FFN2_9ERIC|nr:putative LRR receptor-like serine/threonine-protein kinase [Camellia lanceoleosa]